MAKKRKRKIKSGVWLLLLLTAILIVVVMTVPIFEIRTVIVEGNSRLTAEEIHAAAAVPKGTNIFRVRMQNIEERVLTLPYVKTAKVNRRFPDKVRIAISEREEAAAIKSGGGYAVIDDTGRVLRLSLEKEDMLIFSGCEVENAEVGESIRLVEGQTPDDFFTLIASLRCQDLLKEMQTLTIASSIDVQLETKGGMQIYLGSMEDMEYKLQLVKQILHGDQTEIDSSSGGVLRWTSEGQFSYRQSNPERN